MLSISLVIGGCRRSSSRVFSELLLLRNSTINGVTKGGGSAQAPERNVDTVYVDLGKNTLQHLPTNPAKSDIASFLRDLHQKQTAGRDENTPCRLRNQ